MRRENSKRKQKRALREQKRRLGLHKGTAHAWPEEGGGDGDAARGDADDFLAAQWATTCPSDAGARQGRPRPTLALSPTPADSADPNAALLDDNTVQELRQRDAALRGSGAGPGDPALSKSARRCAHPPQPRVTIPREPRRLHARFCNLIHPMHLCRLRKLRQIEERKRKAEERAKVVASLRAASIGDAELSLMRRVGASTARETRREVIQGAAPACHAPAPCQAHCCACHCTLFGCL